MIIHKDDFIHLLKGAVLYGGGGGGSLNDGEKLLENIGDIRLLTYDELNGSILRDYAISHFAIGSLESEIRTFSSKWLKNTYETLFEKTNYLIGGEMGAYVLAANIRMSIEAEMLLLDTDAGGGRAIPTTLSDLYSALSLKRIPLVAASSKRNLLVIQNIEEEKLDRYLDNFFDLERQVIEVIGYRTQVKNLPFGSITKALKAGKSLEHKQVPLGFKVLGRFKIEELSHKEGRFSTIIIKGGGYELLALNEFIYAKKENRVLATIPLIISIVESESWQPLLSTEVELGMEVIILVGKPLPPMLRPSFYKKYLSPKAFGINIEPTVESNETK